MSFYEKLDTGQGLPLGKKIPTHAFPTWLLVIAGYFALNTTTNRVVEIINLVEEGLPEAKYMGFYIGEITGLLSVIGLVLFVFRRYVFCLYYLIAAGLSNLSMAIASFFGLARDLNSYYFSLRGLESQPDQFFDWLVGWDKVDDSIRGFLAVADPFGSLAFCIFLLYFHHNPKLNAESH